MTSLLNNILLNKVLQISMCGSFSKSKFLNNDLATQPTNTQSLSQDFEELLAEYFMKWQLTPSLLKGETSCFHLNNRIVATALLVSLNGAMLPYNSYSKYLGVIGDCTPIWKVWPKQHSLQISGNNLEKWGEGGVERGREGKGLMHRYFVRLVYSKAEYSLAASLDTPTLLATSY